MSEAEGAEKGLLAASQSGVFSIYDPDQPYSIRFSNNGSATLTITPDGRLERGAGFATNDEASNAFFDCLSELFMSKRPKAMSETIERVSGHESGGVIHVPGSGPITDVMADDAGRITAVRDGVAYFFDATAQEWTRLDGQS